MTDAASKKRLLHRVRRLRGQVEAVGRAIEAEAAPAKVLHGLAAARGALHGLMAAVLAEDVRAHAQVVSPGKRRRAASVTAQLFRKALR